MFGKTMYVSDKVILKSFTIEQVKRDLLPLFGDHTVTRYVMMQHTPDIHQEEDWVKHVGDRKNLDVNWGIFTQDEPDKLRGVTSLHMLDPFYRGATGILIADKTVWGRKLTKKYIHPARMHYADRHCDLKLINSSIIGPNHGSRKTLEAVGYTQVGTLYADIYRDGIYHEHPQFQWFNPRYEKHLFPKGTPDILKDGIERAREILERAQELVRYTKEVKTSPTTRK